MILLRLIRAFLPVATLWVGKLIIDIVVASRNSATVSHDRLWRLVALEIGLVLVGEVISRGSALVESLLGDLF